MDFELCDLIMILDSKEDEMKELDLKITDFIHLKIFTLRIPNMCSKGKESILMNIQLKIMKRSS